MNNKFITPEGTKDYLFEEAVLRKSIENKLMDSFEWRGYHKVVTPSIEFVDVFNVAENGIPSLAFERMYKLIDAKGRLMVLRPDSTLPIARLCSTRLKNEKLPLRLYYNQSVFSSNPSLRGRSDERMQTGIELIGSKGKKSDIEVLVTAVKALECLGIDDFRIELGYIGIFNSLVSSLNVSDSTKETIRKLIEDKNYPALGDVLDNLEQKEIAGIIKSLPRLFGGREVFAKAKKLICSNDETSSNLSYLESLYTSLEKLGLESKITVDLGIVNRNDYYTGVVFKGYIEGYGEEVLSGGRYDGLLKEFSDDASCASNSGAIGFAVNVDSAVKALLDTKSHQKNSTAVLVFADESHEIEALEYINRLTELKIYTEYSLCETAEEALLYAKERNIPRIDIISDTVKTINL